MKYYKLEEELNAVGVGITTCAGSVLAAQHGTDSRIYLCDSFVQDIDNLTVDGVLREVEKLEKRLRNRLR